MSDIVSSLRRSESALQELKKHPDSYQLFRRMIDNRFTADESNRSIDVEQMVPFLFEACSFSVAHTFAVAYYDIHCALFTSPREQHLEQIEALFSDCRFQWIAKALSPPEQELFHQLPDRHQEAYKICRSLSLDTSNEEFPPPTFYLSCQELCTRMGIHKEDGRRILAMFEKAEILQTIKKGTQRQSGQRGVATIYAYNAPQEPKEPAESDCESDIPI